MLHVLWRTFGVYACFSIRCVVGGLTQHVAASVGPVDQSVIVRGKEEGGKV